MIALNAVAGGARAVNRGRRMLGVYWAATLFFALLGVLPASALIAHSLGHSLYAGRQFAAFDPQWTAELSLAAGAWAAVAAPPLAALVAAGYLLASTFLAGGALTMFACTGGAWQRGLFFEGAGRNFGRLFRLLLVSGICYGLVLALGAALNRIPQKLWGEGMVERPIVIFNWFRAALILTLLLVVNMVFDYARIRMVIDDGRSAFAAALASFRLVAGHFAPAAATYALIWGIAVVLLAAWWGVSHTLPRSTLGWLAIVLVAQQAFVLTRIWVKLLFLAGQTEVYRKIGHVSGRE